MKRLLATPDDWTLTVLRLVGAVFVFPHGAQKLLGWFGGYGPSGTIGFFQSMGIPPALGWLAIIAEFFGALGLALGFLTRLSAFGVFTTLAVAMLTVHLKNGWFLNWAGTQKGEGIELFVLALPLFLTLMVRGGGALSVDRALSQARARSSASPSLQPH